jgi:hypothetical protein
MGKMREWITSKRMLLWLFSQRAALRDYLALDFIAIGRRRRLKFEDSINFVGSHGVLFLKVSGTGKSCEALPCPIIRAVYIRGLQDWC